MEYRKFINFNNYRDHITFEIGTLPLMQLGLNIGGPNDDITFKIGCFVQFYISLNSWRVMKWLRNHRISDRDLSFDLWFNNGGSLHISLFADSMGWKKGDWKWYINFSDKLKGHAEVTQKIIEERDILIPMPEKSYEAHAVLADWTWKYKRWFPMTIRKCEIEIPEGIPHEGKGENSWDCGIDRTYGVTTGKVRSIAEAVGNIVGSSLHDRVRYGGWDDWKWTKEER